MDYGAARSAVISLEPEPVIIPANAYKIPGVAGWCCSIACLECVVFGPGRCRSCGTKLGAMVKSYGKTEQEYRAGTKYCSNCCALDIPFGNGERLNAYLLRNYPKILKPDGSATAGKRCALGKKCLKYEDRKSGLVVGEGKYCSKGCADTSRAVANRAKSGFLASGTLLPRASEGGSRP
jgi:hypothetical protein